MLGGIYLLLPYPGGMLGVYYPTTVPGRHAGCVLLYHGTREACWVCITLRTMVGRHVAQSGAPTKGEREACCAESPPSSQGRGETSAQRALLLPKKRKKPLRREPPSSLRTLQTGSGPWSLFSLRFIPVSLLADSCASVLSVAG